MALSLVSVSRGLIAALVVVAGVTGLPGQAQAQGARSPQMSEAQAARAEALLDVIGMPELLEIMRAEGLDYAVQLEAEMFPGQGGAAWTKLVDQIYSVDPMTKAMRDGLALELPQESVGPVAEFFASDLGQRIVSLELSAREALLDDAVEEASLEALDRMRLDNDPRLDLLAEFIEINDLVEMNVVGALNSNFAFFQGLSGGGAFEDGFSETDMLNDVWAQEPEIRAETTDWVFSYLAMAYQPLSDADLQAYIDLSRSPEGRDLNRALFAAFDVLFVEVSRQLGLASARFMAGEDI